LSICKTFAGVQIVVVSLIWRIICASQVNKAGPVECSVMIASIELWVIGRIRTHLEV